MMRLLLFILAIFAVGVDASAATDDATIEFLLNKSQIAVDGVIEEMPMAVFGESGMVDYIVKIKEAQALAGDAVPGRITVTATRFYETEQDALPYLRKGQRCVFFLVTKPVANPIYRTSDFWFSIQPYSVPLARRIRALVK